MGSALARWIRKFAFELGLAQFIIVIALLWLTGNILKDRLRWVDTTYQVLNSLSDLSSGYERLEAQHSDYMLFADKSVLSSYRDSAATLRQKIAGFSAANQSTSEQNDRLLEAKAIIDQRLEKLDEVVRLREQGKVQSARELLARTETHKAPEEIRRTLVEIIARERALLSKRSEEARSTEDELTVLVTVGALLALVLMLVSRILMKRDNLRLAESRDSLEEQGQLMNSIVESMSEGLVVVDRQGRNVRVNRAAENLLGIATAASREAIFPTSARFLNPDTLAPITEEDWPAKRALDGVATTDFQILVKNNSNPEGIVVSTNGQPLRTPSGRLVGAISVFRDISRQKEIERERIAAREAAIEASRKKSDFLATMSHEIRTPMNGIIGMATLMMDSPLNLDQRQFVSTIKSSAESLLVLINGILDHSKIESGKLELQKFDFDFKQIALETHEMFNFVAREKNIDLNFSWSREIDWSFFGDGDRVRQILINLIGNAIKFTERGSVNVSFSKIAPETQSKRHRLRVEVKDSGPGLTKAEISQIFSKYGQTSHGQAKGGSGLGLMISKQLVQLMNGSIGVSSQPGQGATFWFEIELEKATNAVILKKAERHEWFLMKGHLLIAEDQPVNVRVVGRYLEKMGLTYDVAENGLRAVELYAQNKYDLVLMDCRMPVMTGYDAAKRIREIQAQCGIRKPIVALTAEGSSDDRSLCLASGMDEVLSKPLVVSRFVEVLSHYLPSNDLAFKPDALDKLKRFTSHDQNLALALYNDFIESWPRSMQSLRTAHENRDIEAIRDAAHGIKSAAATLGAVRLAQLCQDIEDLRTYQDVPAEVLAHLQKEFEDAKAGLESYLGLSSSVAS